VTLPAGAVAVTAPFTATVWRLALQTGSPVAEGDAVLSVEAMKMEADVTAPVTGRLVELYVSPGDQVDPGQILAAVLP
jgi:urea carboxylase